MRNVSQGTLGAGLFFPDGSGQYSMSFSKDREMLHVFDLNVPAPSLIRFGTVQMFLCLELFDYI